MVERHKLVQNRATKYRFYRFCLEYMIFTLHRIKTNNGGAGSKHKMLLSSVKSCSSYKLDRSSYVENYHGYWMLFEWTSLLAVMLMLLVCLFWIFVDINSGCLAVTFLFVWTEMKDRIDSFIHWTQLFAICFGSLW